MRIHQTRRMHCRAARAPHCPAYPNATSQTQAAIAACELYSGRQGPLAPAFEKHAVCSKMLPFSKQRDRPAPLGRGLVWLRAVPVNRCRARLSTAACFGFCCMVVVVVNHQIAGWMKGKASRAICVTRKTSCADFGGCVKLWVGRARVKSAGSGWLCKLDDICCEVTVNGIQAVHRVSSSSKPNSCSCGCRGSAAGRACLEVRDGALRSRGDAWFWLDLDFDFWG